MQELSLELSKKHEHETEVRDFTFEKLYKSKNETTEDLQNVCEAPFQACLKNLKPVRNGTVGNHNGQTEESIIGGEETEIIKELGNEISPPKPMPRSSRSNSVDFCEDRPIAKPRTHKNSLESSQSIILEVLQKPEAEDDFSAGDRSPPSVIQSVKPLMPVSGGYKVRHSSSKSSLLFVCMFVLLNVLDFYFA